MMIKWSVECHDGLAVCGETEAGRWMRISRNTAVGMSSSFVR